MTENMTSDDLNDHNNDFCISHVMWHIKWKVMTSVIDLSMFSTNWRTFDLTMTENVTSDDLHDKQWLFGIPWKQWLFFVSHIMWHIKGSWTHGGHLKSHFRSWWGQMTSNWSKTLKAVFRIRIRSVSCGRIRIRIHIRKRWFGSGYQNKIVINSHTNQPKL